MKEENSYFKASNPIKGVYGDFIVTPKDKTEVLFYRLSIFSCGLFFSLGLIQWFTNGSSQVWICFAGLAISLGLHVFTFIFLNLSFNLVISFTMMAI